MLCPLFSRPARTLLPALCLGATLATQAATPACDRACLSGLADQLLDSMVARDPARVPLAPRYAATENSVPAALPMMTAWRSVTALKDRFYAIDATSQQVFVVVGLAEGPNETLLWGRLKAQGRQLAEIELYENRSRAQGGYQFAGNGPAHFPKPWTAAVPADRVPARATLQAHGQAIFAGRGKTLPAAPGCVLMENGKVVEEHAEVAAEVAGGAVAAPADGGMVPIPCGLPPQRPTDPKARADIVDEVQGVVVAIATVHGSAQPMLVSTPTESAFVPDQILAPYAAMLKKQQASGRFSAPSLRPLPATAAAAEVHRLYDGRLQGQLLLVNLGAPGSHSPWTR